MLEDFQQVEEIAPWDLEEPSYKNQQQRRRFNTLKHKDVKKSCVVKQRQQPQKYFFGVELSKRSVRRENRRTNISLPKLNQCTVLIQALEKENSKIQEILPKQHYKSLYRRHFLASRKIIRVDGMDTQVSPSRQKSQNMSLFNIKPSQDSSIVIQIRRKMAQKYKSLKHPLNPNFLSP